MSDFAPWSPEGDHGPSRTDLAIDVAGIGTPTGAQTHGTLTVQHWQECRLGRRRGGTVQSTGVHTLSGDRDFTDRADSHGVRLAVLVVRAQGGHEVFVAVPAPWTSRHRSFMSNEVTTSCSATRATT
jgi:hypothetical protein